MNLNLKKTTEHFNISNGPNHTTIDFFHDSEGDMLYLEQSKLTDKVYLIISNILIYLCDDKNLFVKK